jgi:hypothetical protein
MRTLPNGREYETESRENNMITSKNYAIMQLESLVQLNTEAGIYLSDNILEYANKVIDKSLTDETVFPSITSAEDNELIFYWRAGNTSIEVDIDCEEGYYVRVRREDNTEEEKMGMVKDIPYGFIKKELELFTERVNKLNPSWKELFPVLVNS